MRKIKLKPIKRLSFKPPKGTVIAYATPVEAAFLMQEHYEEYARRKTWETIMANVRRLCGYDD